MHKKNFFLLPFFLIILIHKHCLADENEIYVSLPAYTTDLRLKPIETYGSMSIINDTSGRIVEFDSSLQVVVSIAKNFIFNRKKNEFVIRLDQNYKTVKNEVINALDIAYSIKFFMNQKNLPLSKILNNSIQDSEKCKSLDCDLSSFRIGVRLF